MIRAAVAPMRSHHDCLVIGTLAIACCQWCDRILFSSWKVAHILDELL
ncbi:MAG: hypothetical protein ACFB14_02035 [Leptolyngbyaceae cyanobacterium]